MAKTQSPYGLRPRRRVDGLPYAGAMRQLPIASAYGEDIYPGDLVIVGTNGTIERFEGTKTDKNVVGVFMGYQSTDSGQTRLFAPTNDTWVAGTTSTNAMAFIVDDPMVEFMIQADDTLDWDSLGLCFDINNPGTSGRLSSISLDTSGTGTSFKVVDFERDAFSRPGDAYTDVIVKFNPDAHGYLSASPRAS